MCFVVIVTIKTWLVHTSQCASTLKLFSNSDLSLSVILENLRISFAVATVAFLKIGDILPTPGCTLRGYFLAKSPEVEEGGTFVTYTHWDLIHRK